MKAATATATTPKADFSQVDKLRDLLMRLVETNAHELPTEAIQGKNEIKRYFLGKEHSK
ncbi:Uncharacterised protein [uncultured archaeon]|nr:Uncharacterised protein [uncultured archaeon]